MSGLSGPHLRLHPKAALGRTALKVLCCCPVCQWPMRTSTGSQCASKRNKGNEGECLARPAKEAEP